MQLGEYLVQMGERLKRGMADFPTVEQYVGQFNPESDDAVVYTAPAVFYGVVNISDITGEDRVFTSNIVMAAVIVFDTLDPFERNTNGWNAVEQFALLLDGMASITSQASVPTIDGITKRDAPNKGGNAGYSYWTIRFTVPYRWHNYIL